MVQIGSVLKHFIIEHTEYYTEQHRMNMKYCIVTYGCQMNKNDSERIAAVLEKMGMKKAKDKNSADFIVINSCSVRQTAEDRVFGLVEATRRHNNPTKTLASKPIIAVTGCLVGRDKDGKIRKKLFGADLFFRIDELPSLAQKLALWKIEISNRKQKIENSKSQFPLSIFHNQFPISKQPISKICSAGDYLSILPRSDFATSRYLTIQTGCNEFCSYCVVPYARGREYNRPLKEILREAKKLIREGAIEIILLGQIVNKWVAPDPENFSKKDPFKNHFAALLWELNQLEGLKRLHFTAPHPRYMNDETIKALALPKMVNYLHLPVQSGDDKILRTMNRKYAAKDYLKIIKKVRKAKPSIELGTDIIVGFPGETEKQFQNTIKLCKKVGFNIAYISMYSPRSRTFAYKNFPDDIPREVKKRRWRILNDLINR